MKVIDLLGQLLEQLDTSRDDSEQIRNADLVIVGPHDFIPIAGAEIIMASVGGKPGLVLRLVPTEPVLSVKPGQTCGTPSS